MIQRALKMRTPLRHRLSQTQSEKPLLSVVSVKGYRTRDVRLTDLLRDGLHRRERPVLVSERRREERLLSRGRHWRRRDGGGGSRLLLRLLTLTLRGHECVHHVHQRLRHDRRLRERRDVDRRPGPGPGGAGDGGGGLRDAGGDGRQPRGAPTALTVNLVQVAPQVAVAVELARTSLDGARDLLVQVHPANTM